MKIVSNLDREALDALLLQEGYQKRGDDRYTFGSRLALHPMDTAHEVHVAVADDSTCELEVSLPYRFWLSAYDRSCLKTRFERFQETGSLQPLRPFDASTVRGQIGHVFYLLSAVFMGLLTGLLFLWVCLKPLLAQSLEDSTLRLQEYGNNMTALGLKAFPDASWIAHFPDSKLSSSALLLAFLLVFATSLVAVFGLMLSESFKKATALAKLLTCLSMLGLAGGSLWLGGTVTDALVFFLAPLAVWPGYSFITAMRRPYVAEGNSSSTFSGLIVSQILVVCVLFALFLMTSTAYLPKKKGAFLPSFDTVETRLVIRDQILKESSLGKSISDFYYNNVIASRFFLRPPLSTEWVDQTVLYLGKNNDVIGYLDGIDVMVSRIKKDEVPWEWLEALDPKRFEMILVDKEFTDETFWDTLDQTNAALKNQVVILSGHFPENPVLEPFIEDFGMEMLSGSAANIGEGIEQAMYAVQRMTDKTEFRGWLYRNGTHLLMSFGVLLLIVWAGNGLVALLAGFFVPTGFAKLGGVCGLLILGYMLMPYISTITADKEIKGLTQHWSQARSEAGQLFTDVVSLAEGGVAQEQIPSVIADIEGVIEKFWTKETFQELDHAMASEDVGVRIRAMGSLQRILNAIAVMGDVYRAHGLQQVDRSLNAWDKFQFEKLENILDKDEDPRVLYWALGCVQFTDTHSVRDKKRINIELMNKVIHLLEHDSLNVRDQAVLALRLLKDPLAARAIYKNIFPENRESPESCDYVKTHASQVLVELRYLKMP